MKPTARRLAFAMAILALGLLAFDAAWHGVAATRALLGKTAMDAWLRTPTRVDLWSDAYTHFSAAAWMDEDNPRLNSDLGWLTAELALQPRVSHRLRISLRRESLGIFRENARQRPTWARAWGQIMVLKYGLWEFDEEFSHALRRTAELGPAEPTLQRSIVALGLVVWPMLGIREQAAVTGMLRRGLEMDRAGMIDTIRRNNSRPLVCQTAELRALVPELACKP